MHCVQSLQLGEQDSAAACLGRFPGKTYKLSCAPDTDVVAQEGRRVENNEAVPAALHWEGQATRDTIQGVRVRNIRRLFQEQVAV